MVKNSSDGVWYMTAAEYAADTEIKAIPTAKVIRENLNSLYIKTASGKAQPLIISK